MTVAPAIAGPARLPSPEYRCAPRSWTEPAAEVVGPGAAVGGALATGMRIGPVAVELTLSPPVPPRICGL